MMGVGAVVSAADGSGEHDCAVDVTFDSVAVPAVTVAVDHCNNNIATAIRAIGAEGGADGSGEGTIGADGGHSDDVGGASIEAGEGMNGGVDIDGVGGVSIGPPDAVSHVVAAADVDVGICSGDVADANR